MVDWSRTRVMAIGPGMCERFFHLTESALKQPDAGSQAKH
jgi:hypothetical protein